MMKYFVAIVILLFVTPSQVQGQTKVNGQNYAPYVNFLEYDYLGEGNEYAERTVKLQYGVNEEGYYQFSVNNGGTQTVYVYQITEQGIIEQAYFPESYDMIDYRQHKDATDTQKSLVLPTEIYEGLEFNSGYRNQETYQVNTILDNFEVEGVNYYEVVLIEKLAGPQEGRNLFYYAPGVGLIYQSFEHEHQRITISLNNFKGMSLRFLENSKINE